MFHRSRILVWYIYEITGRHLLPSDLLTNESIAKLPKEVRLAIVAFEPLTDVYLAEKYSCKTLRPGYFYKV